MDLIQVLTVIGVAIANIGTTITLFIWATNKSEDNRRELAIKMDEDRRELSIKTEENRKETNRLIEAIQLEMKDFHGRLCTIEERKNNI